MLLFAEATIISIVLGIAILIAVVGLAAGLFFGYQALAARSLRRQYFGLAIHGVPERGDVRITYHTYHGFIAWFTQTEHRVVLPPSDARKLLGRLLRFNLVWGLVTAGVVFIFPLAIFNYFAQ